MRGIVLTVALAAVLRMTGLVPFVSHDVAELVPVETLTVDWQKNEVVLDGGVCRGYGENWETALQDLRSGGNGTVFLGTTEQIVLTKRAVHLLPDIVRSEALRPAAVICVCDGSLPKPEEITAYLSAHNAGVTIQKVQAAMLREEGIAMPVLQNTEGGLRLGGTENR